MKVSLREIAIGIPSDPQSQRGGFKLGLCVGLAVVAAWLAWTFVAGYTGITAEIWSIFHLPVIYVLGPMELFEEKWMFIAAVGLVYAVPIGLLTGIVVGVLMSTLRTVSRRAD